MRLCIGGRAFDRAEECLPFEQLPAGPAATAAASGTLSNRARGKSA